MKNHQQKKKIILISHCLPPIPFGTSFVLQKIMHCFPEGSYVVYTTKLPVKGSNAKIKQLEAPYYYAPAHSAFVSYTKWVSLREWFEVLSIVVGGIKIIRREKISAILVCPTSGNFLLAAYLMHKFCKLPLFVYLLDNFTAAQTFKMRKIIARAIEKKILHSSTRVFVMSEALKDLYKNKYNIDSTLLPHPINLTEHEQQMIDDWKLKGNDKNDGSGKKRIIFTGMIYEAQFDALMNLAAAVKELPHVELHIYSSRSAEKLADLGLAGDGVIHHGFVEQKELSNIQASADILFLPMAFNSPYPEIIKTASPSKLPEYLAAGRPILVHAPDYAYITVYARDRGWAAIVDQPDAKLLCSMILRLLSDVDYCEQLIKRAKETVLEHDAVKVAIKLREIMNVK